MEEHPLDSVVVDLGSSIIKVGFGNSDAPIAVFPNLTGFLSRPAVQSGVSGNEFYEGDRAQSVRGLLTLRHPLERGVVKDWEGIEHVIHHTLYNEIRVGDLYPILFTERPFTPTSQRERMCSIMFEKYTTPAVSFAMPEVLAAWACGRTTALIVDIGHGVTTIMPVIRGCILRSGVIRADFSGSDLTEYLRKMLTERGYYFGTSRETEIIRDMKEKLCYVPLDYENELQTSLCSVQLKRQYEMPDGCIVELDSERFRCPEALFQPSVVGKELPGIHQMIEASINRVERDLRDPLRSNIILVGGTTMLPGFADRLHKELTNLMPSKAKIKVIATPERRYAAWIGGSMMASLSSSKNIWLTRDEYNEYGPAYSRVKCLYL